MISDICARVAGPVVYSNTDRPRKCEMFDSDLIELLAPAETRFGTTVSYWTRSIKWFQDRCQPDIPRWKGMFVIPWFTWYVNALFCVIDGFHHPFVWQLTNNIISTYHFLIWPVHFKVDKNLQQLLANATLLHSCYHFLNAQKFEIRNLSSGNTYA